MKTFPKIALLTGFCLAGISGLKAQMGFSGWGLNTSGTTGSVSGTGGLVDFKNFNSGSGFVTFGIQQPFEIFGPTGLNPNLLSGSHDISVFPNPAKERVIIQLTGFRKTGIPFELINIQGITLHKGLLESEQTQIDISGFQGSIFFIRILQDGQSAKTYKLLKSNSL